MFQGIVSNALSWNLGSQESDRVLTLGTGAVAGARGRLVGWDSLAVLAPFLQSPEICGLEAGPLCFLLPVEDFLIRDVGDTWKTSVKPTTIEQNQ